MKKIKDLPVLDRPRERLLLKFFQKKANFNQPIIDEIDCVLARHYGFTEEGLDFIVNYDIKYRMGRGNDRRR